MTTLEFSLFLSSALVLGFLFLRSAAAAPEGCLCLSCVLLVTTAFYFIYLPMTALLTGANYFMGLSIGSPIFLLVVVWLYLFGALLGFDLATKIGSVTTQFCTGFPPRSFHRVEFVFWGCATLGCLLLVNVGALQFTESDLPQGGGGSEFKFLFVLQSLNLLIPLTLILSIRRRFDRLSLFVISVVLFLFLTAGFRFRLLILLFSLATAFVLINGWKPRLSIVAPLGFLFLISMNVIGQIRTYGSGVSFEGFNATDLLNTSGSFGGETGVILATAYIAENVPQKLYYFDPWIVAVARLIPSVVWPEKPTPDYLYYILSGTDTIHADSAGIAFSQPAEILLQFGYVGLAVVAAMYFAIAAKISSTGTKWAGVYGLALSSLCPAFFGYYMISRGYFFQILADGLFIIGPALLLGRLVQIPTLTLTRAR